jgi:hypothetical protein
MLGAFALMLFAATACGGSSGAKIGCETNADCPNPLVCDVEDQVCVDPDTETPYDCEPPLPGCECNQSNNDEPIVCLLDDQPADLVGSCREGRSLCGADGFYGQCEAVANVYCTSVGVSSGDFDLTDDNSDQVELGPEGEIVLVPDVKQVDFGYLWIANTGDNTVSKVDIENGNEVARYAAVRGSNGLNIPGVPSPGGYNGDNQNCGNCPSRTAIDFKGDAFVANRAFGRQGTVTKFANSFEDCVDRDGNGVIDTSADVNGDGRIDINSTSEFLGESDECILWTTPVGGNGGTPRAIAIDAGGPDGEAGNVWVGLYSENRVIQISGDTGDPVTRNGSAVVVDTQGQAPYGAAVDGGGNLWVTGLDDGDETYLVKVNTFSATLTQIYSIPDDDDGCSRGYGIAIDTKQRIWLGGWNCQDVKVFDQETENFFRSDFDDVGNTRGVAVDTNNNVWVAFNDGKVGRIDVDDLINLGNNAPVELIDMPLLPGFADNKIDATIGVGIDRNGACWAVSRNDEEQYGTATRIDTNGDVTAFPVGHRPYTYSDFTGFGLANVVRPSGYWRGVIEGCATTDAITDWAELTWFENEPPGTTVRMRVRVADTVAGLANATWYGPWDDSPVDLSPLPDAKVMEVEVQLSTEDPEVSPSFIGFSVAFGCPGAPPIP